MKVYHEGKNFLREGMTEIEFGGLLEATAKRYGHEGLIRVRSMNYEAYTWHILSGPNGSIISQSDSPVGGLGLSPAFPVGASLRVIMPHEPILVDFGTCYHGYQVDETRMFSIGRMPKKFVDGYKVCEEIYESILDQIKDNADCETVKPSSGGHCCWLRNWDTRILTLAPLVSRLDLWVMVSALNSMRSHLLPRDNRTLSRKV